MLSFGFVHCRRRLRREQLNAAQRLAEPRPSDDAIRACPNMQDAQAVAFFLHVRGRK